MPIFNLILSFINKFPNFTRILYSIQGQINYEQNKTIYIFTPSLFINSNKDQIYTYKSCKRILQIL